MQQPIDHSIAAEKESKLLISVAVGLGCVLVLCVAIAVLVVILALIWTLQGQLGPGSSSAAPALFTLVSLTG